MNQTIIITHAVLIGLTPLIPIPVLDDFVKSFFYKRLVRTLAARYKLTLSTNEINVLSEDRGQGVVRGCLIGAIEYFMKRLISKLTVVLEWRRAIDIVTHAYYVGYLMDYAFQQGWYVPGDVRQSDRFRSAIETARANANTQLVKRIVQSSFNQSRAIIVRVVQQVSRSLQEIAFRRSRVWLRRLLAVRLRARTPRLARWLYKRLHFTEEENAQAAEVENTVAEKLEQEAPEVEGALQGLISRLETYLDAFQKEHEEHFTGLQKRLEAALLAGTSVMDTRVD
jgi:hypothetical protein